MSRPTRRDTLIRIVIGTLIAMLITFSVHPATSLADLAIRAIVCLFTAAISVLRPMAPRR